MSRHIWVFSSRDEFLVITVKKSITNTLILTCNQKLATFNYTK